MDGQESNVAKLAQNKRISIQKLDKIFKVNLFCRFFISLVYFSLSKWCPYMAICKFNRFLLSSDLRFMTRQSGLFLLQRVIFF